MTDQNVDRYQTLTPQQHVLKRKAIYAGDCVTKTVPRAVCSDGAMVSREAETNDGLLKLFDEALDNAVDNVFRDPPTQTVRVNMDGATFECMNDGAHIPVQTTASGQYVASEIFFKMFSGSNFDDEAGREAAGVSLSRLLCPPLLPPTLHPPAHVVGTELRPSGVGCVPVASRQPRVLETL